MKNPWGWDGKLAWGALGEGIDFATRRVPDSFRDRPTPKGSGMEALPRTKKNKFIDSHFWRGTPSPPYLHYLGLMDLGSTLLTRPPGPGSYICNAPFLARLSLPQPSEARAQLGPRPSHRAPHTQSKLQIEALCHTQTRV